MQSHRRVERAGTKQKCFFRPNFFPDAPNEPRFGRIFFPMTQTECRFGRILFPTDQTRLVRGVQIFRGAELLSLARNDFSDGQNEPRFGHENFPLNQTRLVYPCFLPVSV